MRLWGNERKFEMTLMGDEKNLKIGWKCFNVWNKGKNCKGHLSSLFYCLTLYFCIQEKLANHESGFFL